MPALKRRRALCLAAASILLGAASVVAAGAPARIDLFDRVVETLRAKFFDKDWREHELPGLAQRFADRAHAAKSLDQQRRITQELLANVPASHLALLSAEDTDRIWAELGGRPEPTFGFELIEYDGKYFAYQVLDDGPAAEAGLLSGDRVAAIDGVPTEQSARLGWRTDDAYLPDPPVHDVRCAAGDVVRLRIERHPREWLDVQVPAREYSAFQSTKDGARVIEYDGLRIGYVHLWYIYMSGCVNFLRDKLQSDFADCDALILDLRGHGGNGMAVAGILGAFKGKNKVWDKPVVALINGLTRSAKEIIAYEMRNMKIATLVGEPTAGAVIPASFADVGNGMVLMLPTFRLGHYTDAIEGKPVQPHIRVKDAGPYSAGRQPLIEAGLREAARRCRPHGLAG